MRKGLLLGTFVLSCAAMLTGCFEQPKKIGERVLTMQVTSVYLTSKSNSKVTLKDVKTGKVYKDERLSCSREKAKKVEIGSLWTVHEVDYVYPESKRYFSDLVGTAAICTKSNY